MSKKTLQKNSMFYFTISLNTKKKSNYNFYGKFFYTFSLFTKKLYEYYKFEVYD